MAGGGVPMGGGVPIEKLRPKWQDSSKEAFDKAIKEDKQVVLHFVDPTNDKADDIVFSAGLYERSEEKAVFIHVRQAEKPADSDAKPEQTGGRRADAPARAAVATRTSPFRASRLEAADLWAEYNVDLKTGGGTFIVADKYGNEVKRLTGSLTYRYRELERAIDQVPDFVEARVKRLESDVARAKAEVERGRVERAFARINTITRQGFVGHKPMVELEEMYERMIEEGRDKLDDAVMHGDIRKLADLKKVYKGTELEADILEAEKTVAKD
jgi:hypothetical protein